MNTKKRIAQNTALQLLLQVFNLAAGFYSISLIAKYLGSVSFGKYAFVSSFYFFFLTFLDFGITTLMLREVSAKRDQAGNLLSEFIVFKGGISIALIAVALTVVSFSPFPFDLKVAIALYAPVLLFIALESIQIIFEADLRMEYVVLASFVWRVVSLALVIAAVKLDWGLPAIILSFVAAECCKWLCLYIFSRKLVQITFIVPTQLSRWIAFIKSSLPIGITTLLITIIRNVDVMLLTKIKGFQEVGIYQAAYRLSDIGLTVPIALMASIFPLLSKYYKEDARALQATYQKTFDILAACGILLVVLVLARSHEIVMLLFGVEFVRATGILKILIFSSLWVYLGIVPGVLLVATNRQKEEMWFYCIATALSISLNFLLIPLYGGKGAAVANCTAMMVVVLLVIWRVHTALHVVLKLGRFTRALCAGIVTLVVFLLFRKFSLLLVVPLGVVVYGVLLVAMNVIDKKDIMLLFWKKSITV